MTRKNDSLTSKLGTKIRLLRLKQKYSQEKLAELADINKNSLGAIERGTSVPSIETLDKIAAALNIELKELVDVSKIDL